MLRKLLGSDPVTSAAGLVSIIFVSLYLLKGGCSLNDYLLALASIATAFGLFRAKDSDGGVSNDKETKEDEK